MSRAPTRLLVLDVSVVLALFLVAGALSGALWPQLADPVTVTKGELGLTTSEVALSERFDSDGWYSVLAAGCGLVLGLVLTAWRRTDEVLTLLSVVAGAWLAAWVSAEVGTLVGPDDPREVLATARLGATAPDTVSVSSAAAYFLWPISAVIGAMVVLWSPPDQRLLSRSERTPAESMTPSA